MNSTAPDSVLIVRLGAMGDIVHTLWAISALRTAIPEMRIGWTVEERWLELLCAKKNLCGPRARSRPVVDCVHLLNTKNWRRSPLSAGTWRQIAALLWGIREDHYLLAVDFQGAIKSAMVARLAGANAAVGDDSPRETPARFFYQRRVPTKGAHVIEHYRSLAESIAGRPLPLARPEFPYDDESEVRVIARLGDSRQGLVIMNPGAGWGAKQWPAERYGRVASALARDGMKTVINFSPRERDLALAVEAAGGGSAVPLDCTIADLMALTRRARLFIGGDTGPLHLAAALGIPVVAIFGPTDPTRNGPYGTKSVVLRNPASRTSFSHTSVPDPGLLQITAEEVIRAARQLLENSNE